MSLAHVDMLVTVGEAHTDAVWSATPDGFLPPRSLTERRTVDVYAHLRVPSVAAGEQQPTQRIARAGVSDVVAALAKLKTPANPKTKSPPKTPSPPKTKSVKTKSVKLCTVKSVKSLKSLKSAKDTTLKPTKPTKPKKKAPCNSTTPSPTPAPTPPNMQEAPTTTASTTATTTQTTTETTKPDQTDLAGFTWYYGGNFNETDAFLGNLGIWLTDVFLPGTLGFNSSSAWISSINASNGLGETNGTLLNFNYPNVAADEAAYLLAISPSQNPDYTLPVGEVIIPIDMARPVATTRRARRDGISHVARRNLAVNSTVPFGLDKLRRKFFTFRSNMFLNNNSCMDTSNVFPCTPNVGNRCPSKEWCDNNVGVGKWNTPPVLKFEGGKWKTCYTRCGMEELFRRSCPIVQWRIRRGSFATVANHYFRNNVITYFSGNQTDEKIVATVPPVLAWGISSTYDWKLTGRMSIVNDEFSLSTRVDVSSLDLSQPGPYYFSLTPLCHPIKQPTNETYVPGNASAGIAPAYTDTIIAYPHVYLSNVAENNTAVTMAVGPIVDEGKTLYFGKMYTGDSHERFKWATSLNVIDVSSVFGAGHFPVDRWSAGLSVSWVPKIAKDCNDCFNIVNGSPVCSYLISPAGTKILNKGDCLALV